MERTSEFTKTQSVAEYKKQRNIEKLQVEKDDEGVLSFTYVDNNTGECSYGFVASGYDQTKPSFISVIVVTDEKGNVKKYPTLYNMKPKTLAFEL